LVYDGISYEYETSFMGATVVYILDVDLSS